MRRATTHVILMHGNTHTNTMSVHTGPHNTRELTQTAS